MSTKKNLKKYPSYQGKAILFRLDKNTEAKLKKYISKKKEQHGFDVGLGPTCRMIIKKYLNDIIIE